jgi:hypothetical protein
MTTNNPTPSSPDPIQENDALFWADMEKIQEMQRQNVLADELEEDRENQMSDTRMLNAILNEGDKIQGPTASSFNVTTPSPISLAGGASAPSTNNNSNKMNNQINQV